MTTITVAIDQLSNTVLQALKKQGLDRDERQAVHDVLMYAQKRGSSQGLIKIKERTTLPDIDNQPIKTVMRSGAIATIDGGGHTGMLVLQKATDTAVNLVSETGIALVNTINTRSSTGSIGYYARQLADQGFIGIVLAGSPKVMAIEGGIDPVLGTNPIAIAVPGSNSPLVLDMATAATTWFSVIDAKDKNQPIPKGVALDANGNPTVDARAALSGALKTFGGAKGSGLALMFELLTAPLAGASVLGDSEDNRANTIIAINPEIVLGDNSYKNRVDHIIEKLKAGRTDNEQIRLPGEHSDTVAAQSEASNSINIDSTLHDHLVQLAE